MYENIRSTCILNKKKRSVYTHWSNLLFCAKISLWRIPSRRPDFVTSEAIIFFQFENNASNFEYQKIAFRMNYFNQYVISMLLHFKLYNQKLSNYKIYEQSFAYNVILYTLCAGSKSVWRIPPRRLDIGFSKNVNMWRIILMTLN